MKMAQCEKWADGKMWFQALVAGLYLVVWFSLLKTYRY